MPLYQLKDPSSVAVVDDGSVIVNECEMEYYVYKYHFSRVDIAAASFVRKRTFDVAFACMSFKNNVIIAGKSLVHILTPDAETVREMTDPISLTNPCGLAVSSITGFIYIADGAHACVHILTPELRFIKSFGKHGRGDGEFTNAQGITIAVIDGEEFLYIPDYNNHRIQKFTVQGQFLSAFGSQGNGPGQLMYPCGITIGTGSLLYVTETGNHRVSVFTCGGDFVTCFGQRGSNIDQFNNPQGIAFDKNGIMYVCDCGNNRLVLY